MSQSAGFSETSEMERQAMPPERSKWLIWPWLLLAAGLAAVLVFRAVRGPAESAALNDDPAAGVKLTTFRLEPLTGNGQAVSEADLVGKVTLINLWGPWCGACIVEFPHLMEIERHFRNRTDFQFFSISSNYDPRDDAGLAESTEHFLKQRQADFPTYRDPEAATTVALIREAKLESFGYPTTVLIDRTGAIRKLWAGFTPGDERQIHQAIERLLQEAKPSTG